MSKEKEQGVVKFFNGQKGYGFITPNNGGKDLFVHASNVDGGSADLTEGCAVEFEVGTGRKGPEATAVSKI